MRGRLRLLSCLAVAVAVMTLMSPAALAERRVAVVIGNSSYQNVARLSNPVNDAAAIAALFEAAGFDVVTALRDLGNLEFKRAVRDFTALARGADIAVIFYAGHGIEIGGGNYLLPVDAKLAKDYDAEDEAVPLDRIVRALEPARRLRLVLLDACRDNPFVRTMQRTLAVRAVTGGLAKVEPMTTDTLIAFAAKAGSTAEDGSGPHSPFTAALLKHIAAPGLDIQMALRRVRDEVLRSTGNRQEPYVYGSLGGSEIALVPPAAAPPKPAAPDVRGDYQLAERIGTREAWESFLAAHPDGFFAELARAQLAKLTLEARLAEAGDPERPAPPRPAEQGRPARERSDQEQARREVKTAMADATAGPYDGDWNGPARANERTRQCKPANVAVTISESQVLGKATFDSDVRNINGTVRPDGAFGGTIGFRPLAGRFLGDRFEGTFSISDCRWNVVLRRQTAAPAPAAREAQ